MDLLLIILSATALVALGLVADRIGRDLSPCGRFEEHAAWPKNDVRPMRLELLARSSDEVVSIGPDRTDQAARRAADEALASRPVDPTRRQAAAS